MSATKYKIVDQAGKGKGLQATALIKKGEIICEYSADKIDFTKPFQQTKAIHEKIFGTGDVCYRGDLKTAGDAVLINDRADPDVIRMLGTVTDVKLIEFWATVLYPRSCALKFNAELKADSEHAFAIATEDIAAGQDIYTMYGPLYWVQQAAFSGHSNPHFNGVKISRLACIAWLLSFDSLPVVGTETELWYVYNPVRNCLLRSYTPTGAQPTKPPFDEVKTYLRKWLELVGINIPPNAPFDVLTSRWKAACESVGFKSGFKSLIGTFMDEEAAESAKLKRPISAVESPQQASEQMASTTKKAVPPLAGLIADPAKEGHYWCPTCEQSLAVGKGKAHLVSSKHETKANPPAETAAAATSKPRKTKAAAADTEADATGTAKTPTAAAKAPSTSTKAPKAPRGDAKSVASDSVEGKATEGKAKSSKGPKASAPTSLPADPNNAKNVYCAICQVSLAKARGESHLATEKHLRAEKAFVAAKLKEAS